MSVTPGFGGQTFIHSSLRRIESLLEIRQTRGQQFRIEVDGGVHHGTVADVVCAGAEILVAGSAIFEQGDPRENAKQLLESALEAAKQPVQVFSPPARGTSTGEGDDGVSLR